MSFHWIYRRCAHSWGILFELERTEDLIIVLLESQRQGKGENRPNKDDLTSQISTLSFPFKHLPCTITCRLVWGLQLLHIREPNITNWLRTVSYFSLSHNKLRACMRKKKLETAMASLIWCFAAFYAFLFDSSFLFDNWHHFCAFSCEKTTCPFSAVWFGSIRYCNDGVVMNPKHSEEKGVPQSKQEARRKRPRCVTIL